MHFRRSALSSQKTGTAREAFTLVELLTVLAIIGILLAILFPTVRAARTSANKAKTRVQFNQWAAALESFRQEYGYYPALHSSALVNGGAVSDPSSDHIFHDVLAARRRNGAALTAADNTGPTSAAGQNRKLIPFHSFSEPEMNSAGLLRNAFDNTEIAVLTDRNLDGIINAADYGALPLVGGMRPSANDIPIAGIRAGAVFYAPTPGATSTNPDFIFSWK
jgi:prepilin-type N-terminal cleavage/methylation domain-containing protein